MPERRNKMLQKKKKKTERRQAKHAKKNTIDCPRNKMYSKRIFSSSSKKFNSATCKKAKEPATNAEYKQG